MSDILQKKNDMSVFYKLFNRELIEDEETPGLSTSDDLICFIIGGTEFQILKSKFAYWPKTRLSQLIRAKTTDEILTICDNVIFCEISKQPKKYIFLRNGRNFNSILDKYINFLTSSMKSVLSMLFCHNLCKLIDYKFIFFA